jgi:transcriptional regulator
VYIPDHFRMPPADVPVFLNEAHTGTLVSVAPSGRPVASFLPWAFIDGDTLTSHIGRINEQGSHHGEALVILMGDDAYVPETWMKPGAAASWVYETVHLYGTLTIHDDPGWIKKSWADMMARFSDKTLADYDDDWLDRQTRASLGVEFRITEIQAKSKLAQNRSSEEIASIASHVTVGCPHLAERMQTVSGPHAEARETRVRNAVPYATLEEGTQ